MRKSLPDPYTPRISFTFETLFWSKSKAKTCWSFLGFIGFEYLLLIVGNNTFLNLPS